MKRLRCCSTRRKVETRTFVRWRHQVHYWNDASEYASLFFEGWYWSYLNRYWESVFSTHWRLAHIFSNAFMPCLNFTGHGLQELWFVEYLKFLEICVVPRKHFIRRPWIFSFCNLCSIQYITPNTLFPCPLMVWIRFNPRTVSITPESWSFRCNLK